VSRVEHTTQLTKQSLRRQWSACQ